VVGAALTACARPADDVTRARIRIAVLPYLSNAPLYLARDAGYFADEGIDVELVELKGTDGRLAAMLSGDIDVLAGAIEVAQFAAIAAGASLRAVADKGRASPDACAWSAYLVGPGVDTASGVRAIRRMTVDQSDISTYLVHELIRREGGDPATVEVVRTPPPAVPAALRSGAVDAAAVTEPQLMTLRRQFREWRTINRVVPDFQMSAVQFGRRLLVEDRALGVRVLRAYRRGVAQYLRGKTPDNVRHLANAFATSPAELSAMCWPHIQRDGRINLASVMAYQEWALAQGLIDRRVPASQLWDSTFVRDTDDGVRTATTP
jgi:NitT/TauT family transport system substrate-binding protein